MPELPEVQTVVDTLRPNLIGRTILAVTLHRPDVLCPPGTDLAAALVGRAIGSIDRRGKRIVFTLADGSRFYVHLGMTGQLTIARAGDAVQSHTHLVIEIEDGGSRMEDSREPSSPSSILHALSSFFLRFRDPRRFGGVWWCGSGNAADANMGPEPLTLRPSQLAKRLAVTRRPVKSALLDQAVVAGLGNIYVDESLFAARIHPLARACDLSTSDVARLNRAIKSTLRRAIRHRGSTLRDYRDANGAAGGFQLLHRVYDRAGQPCRACRTPVQRIVLGGRSTHFCPRCQPG